MGITGWKICAQVFLDATLEFLFFKLKMEQYIISNSQSPAFPQKDFLWTTKTGSGEGLFAFYRVSPGPNQ